MIITTLLFEKITSITLTPELKTRLLKKHLEAGKGCK
jgi:hypothetical protein